MTYAQKHGQINTHINTCSCNKHQTLTHSSWMMHTCFLHHLYKVGMKEKSAWMNEDKMYNYVSRQRFFILIAFPTCCTFLIAERSLKLITINTVSPKGCWHDTSIFSTVQNSRWKFDLWQTHWNEFASVASALPLGSCLRSWNTQTNVTNRHQTHQQWD